MSERGKKIERKCRCGAAFQAREADVKRGWGKYCSKSCKASAQEARTGQHREYNRVRRYAQEYGGQPVFDSRGDYVGFMGIDHEHDCNKD